MTNNGQGLERRTFLKRMATVAGTAPLAPGFLGAAAAQTAPTAPQAGGTRRNEETNHETKRLAAYAAALRFEDLPPAVLQRAKDCITDGVATIAYGAELPWSKMIIAYARRYGGGGKSFILGAGATPVQAPSAALANGALAHAFELDSSQMPDSGSHPGATLLTSGLAVSQERGYGGRELVTAFVAGAEVMSRIGHATKHSNEIRGFHAPGTTGPFGAAVAVGRLHQFDAEKMTNALGIAGSCAGGLLEFVNSGDGAMVKRLHLGRAAESGVLAASLAADGFTGPTSVVEGEFGFLRVFCNEWDMSELTRDMGGTYFTMDIYLKHYACHGTAQNPIEAIEDLRGENKFSAADVASITIAGNDRVVKRNNIPAPAEKMMAQYSVPFSVALSLYRDARDPRSFDDAVVHDRDILDLASRTKMTVAAGQDHRDPTTNVTVRLKDGRELSRRVSSFKGTPAHPLNRAELKDKFLLLTRHLDRGKMEAMFERLQNIENEKSLDWLSI
jgi:2-methylcitrate dehydratase PrpD